MGTKWQSSLRALPYVVNFSFEDLIKGDKMFEQVKSHARDLSNLSNCYLSFLIYYWKKLQQVMGDNCAMFFFAIECFADVKRVKICFTWSIAFLPQKQRCCTASELEVNKIIFHQTRLSTLIRITKFNLKLIFSKEVPKLKAIFSRNVSS